MKTVLVTGASGGIGSAAALELARPRLERGPALPQQPGRRPPGGAGHPGPGGTAKTYQADLTQEAQVEALFAAAEGDFGFVEGLVNNAGTAWKGLFTDMTLGDWRQVLDARFDQRVPLLPPALPPMIRRKRGSIVNVSSMWGQVGASWRGGLFRGQGGGHRPDEGPGPGGGPLGHPGELPGAGGHRHPHERRPLPRGCSRPAGGDAPGPHRHPPGGGGGHRLPAGGGVPHRPGAGPQRGHGGVRGRFCRFVPGDLLGAGSPFPAAAPVP